MPAEQLDVSDFYAPAISLWGPVNDTMYSNFRNMLLNNIGDRQLVVIELSTLGGDPEVARMMGEDVRFISEQYPDKRFVFLGKATIYSAGVTFMSFFARANRYVTRGTRLMIHERKLDKKIPLEGPLTTCVARVKALLNEIEASIAIQNEGFQNLVVGSQVTIETVLERAPENWYVEAIEAQQLGLIERVV